MIVNNLLHIEPVLMEDDDMGIGWMLSDIINISTAQNESNYRAVPFLRTASNYADNMELQQARQFFNARSGAGNMYRFSFSN